MASSSRANITIKVVLYLLRK